MDKVYGDDQSLSLAQQPASTSASAGSSGPDSQTTSHAAFQAEPKRSLRLKSYLRSVKDEATLPKGENHGQLAVSPAIAETKSTKTAVKTVPYSLPDSRTAAGLKRPVHSNTPSGHTKSSKKPKKCSPQLPRKVERIQMACHECRRNKRRCSGERPCTLCKLRNKECEYDAVRPSIDQQALSPPPGVAALTTDSESSGLSFDDDDTVRNRCYGSAHPQYAQLDRMKRELRSSVGEGSATSPTSDAHASSYSTQLSPWRQASSPPALRRTAPSSLLSSPSVVATRDAVAAPRPSVAVAPWAGDLMWSGPTTQAQLPYSQTSGSGGVHCLPSSDVDSRFSSRAINPVPVTYAYASASRHFASSTWSRDNNGALDAFAQRDAPLAASTPAMIPRSLRAHKSVPSADSTGASPTHDVSRIYSCSDLMPC